MRRTALLHLQDPTDFDEAAGQFTLRPEWDKQGEQHVLPILPLTCELLAIARAWRERLGYKGPWLFFAANSLNKGDTFTLSALWTAIKNGQRRAGIKNITWRGGHIFRRGVVDDMLAQTSDTDLALKAIGDSDPRMAKAYAVKRNERIDRARSKRADNFSHTSKRATNVQPNVDLAKIGTRRKSRSKLANITITRG